jgi:uncharacterized protein (DUF2252 family)
MTKKGKIASEHLQHPLPTSLLKKPIHLRTLRDRYEAGKAFRETSPRASQAELQITSNRKDPIDILIESGKNRIQPLLPIRYGRMSTSPFAFYRGAAAIMAADLSQTPSMGYFVQACGDCHIANFGAFGTPEHQIFFDINDFDETYPAPWEWDLKRLTTSFVIASQNNGFNHEDIESITRYLVKCYNDKLHELAAMPTLAAWSYFLEYEDLLQMIKDNKLKAISEKQVKKAERLNPHHEFIKLAHMVIDRPVITDQPPLIYHFDDEKHPGQHADTHRWFKMYYHTLPIERRILLERYELVDVAMKVVGVGSVGTFCAIALLFSGYDDPLFLQLKEAQSSVLEPYVKHHHFTSQGERVVYGQHIMQTASDIFLGHFMDKESSRHFYIRKLHDVKIKPLIETFTPKNMKDYAKYCGWALARAHARSCDPAIIAGYIGNKGREFAEAIAQFSLAYAELNQKDYDKLVKAIQSGKVKAQQETEKK